MDISIARNDFQTLVDIIIVDPTCTNLLQHASTMTTHVATLATQYKHDLTHNEHQEMISFPLQ
jgi:hypothetical protein